MAARLSLSLSLSPSLSTDRPNKQAERDARRDDDNVLLSAFVGVLFQLRQDRQGGSETACFTAIYARLYKVQAKYGVPLG